MRAKLAAALLFSLFLLGCYAPPGVIGGEAPIITTSKNFTMKEGWQESFKIVVDDSTTTHKVITTNLAQKAAMLKLDDKSILLQVGETKSVSLKGKVIFVTLNEVEEGYAKFTISLSQPEMTPTTSKAQNGRPCSADSDCLSNHCSNGYCCVSGACCISDANCSIGRCNTTTYSCFTPQLLPNGSPCNSDSDCASNHCSNGYCCQSGRCCLSNSNCNAGEICNTTTYSCAQVSLYTVLAAEQKANSTQAGQLMARLSALFQTARECEGGSATYKQCIPYLSTRTDKLSASRFKITYSYAFNGTSCCPTSPLLEITVDLSTNNVTTQWIDTTINSSVVDDMNASLISDCASALNRIACVYR